ncbi:MAG: hypothetical protein ABIJ05_03790 [Patescibacteria group bacterium]
MFKENITKNNSSIRLIEYFFILVILFLTAINLNISSKEDKVLGTTIENINLTKEKISFLENMVKENPLYFDAYLELINLNLEESNIGEAKKYFEIARSINPNTQILKTFGETFKYQ